MSKLKKDDVFCCPDCGLEIVVNKACKCVDPNLVCCGGPMMRGRDSSSQAGMSTSEKSSGKVPYRRGSM